MQMKVFDKEKRRRIAFHVRRIRHNPSRIHLSWLRGYVAGAELSIIDAIRLNARLFQSALRRKVTW